MATRTLFYKRLEQTRRKMDLLMKQVENQNMAEDLLLAQGVTLTSVQLKAIDDKLATTEVKSSWDVMVAEFISSKPTV